MEAIVKLIKKQNPIYNGHHLTLDDVEFISSYTESDKLLFYCADEELLFKARNGPLGYGVYFSNDISNAVYLTNQTLFTIIGCKVDHLKILNYGPEYCIVDEKIIPCCFIYMSIRQY